MTDTEEAAPLSHDALPNGTFTASAISELDVSTIEGLRQFQRDFIRDAPTYLPSYSASNAGSLDYLVTSFSLLLSSASRADKSIEWQLAALDALSIWLLRATRSTHHVQIASHISPSEWQTLAALTWTRWASAPNSNAIQKILKEMFSKTLVLQRNLYPDWNAREVALLERVTQMHSMDMKVQCYLIEVLVRRVSNGAERLLNLEKDWVATMLAEMKDGGIGPAVGKCIVTVLMARRAELMEHNEVRIHPSDRNVYTK